MRTIFISLIILCAFKANGQFLASNLATTDGLRVHKRHTYPTPPNSKNTLFYIQRSNNASAIVYDGNTDSKGKLNEDDPVHVYWMSYSQDSSMNELNYIQRKLAYGVTVYNSQKHNELEISLVSYKKRKIKIFKNKQGEMQANILINDKIARFRNVYVEIAKNFFIPEISYVEIFGEDLETGEAVYEKFYPNQSD